MNDRLAYGVLRIVSYAIIAAMATAMTWAGYTSLSYWTGIGV